MYACYKINMFKPNAHFYVHIECNCFKSYSWIKPPKHGSKSVRTGAYRRGICMRAGELMARQAKTNVLSKRFGGPNKDRCIGS